MPQKLKKLNWFKFNERYIVGLDEVGRGCLAGDVYAAAVLFDLKSASIKKVIQQLRGVTDSKLLSPQKRQIQNQVIQENCSFAIGTASVEEIAELNILKASLLAMKRAFLKLHPSSNDWQDFHLLIDGNQFISDLKVRQTTVVKGDRRALPIAAASIVAKVARDEELARLSHQYPKYGFEIHKGYPTKAHKEAIQKWGCTPIHRRTFAGVEEFWSNSKRSSSRSSS